MAGKFVLEVSTDRVKDLRPVSRVPTARRALAHTEATH